MSKTIEQLNFQVILDDKDFNDRIGKDLEAAKGLNTQLSALLDLQDKVKKTKGKATNPAKEAIEQQRLTAAKAQAAAAEERLNTAKKNGLAASERLATASTNRAAAEARATTAVTRSVRAQKAMAESTMQVNGALGKQGRILRELSGLAVSYLSIRGVASFVSSLVRVTGEFELQKTTLAAMIGDLNKAEGIITRIQGLAVESPFQFKELTTYAKQLSAFSVPAQELYDTTKMLADISAGLGVGMDRIVLAYGQVRSAAFLRGQEVRQFTEAGIPILDELAKQFEQLEGQAVSTGEVFDRISARLVPFEMVAKVFKDMTSEGGKFYQMQEVQAETLRGKISNLKDAYEIMLNEIGSKESSGIKGAVDGLKDLMQNWEQVGNTIKTVVAILAAYNASMMLIAGGKWVGAFYKLISQWKQLNAVLKLLNIDTLKFSDAMRAAGMSVEKAASVGVAAITALVMIIARAIKNANALRKELDSITATELSGGENKVQDLERLVKNLKEATLGSQQYRDIITDLNRKYGEYLSNVLSEADAYGAVKIAADEATKAIMNKAKASASEKGREAIEKKYGKDLGLYADELKEAITFLDPNIAEKGALEFIKRFKNTIALEGKGSGYFETFSKLFNEFFRRGDFADLLAKASEEVEGYDDLIASYANSYGKLLSKVEAQQRKLESTLELRFGEATYSYYEEMLALDEIEERYRKKALTIYDTAQSQEAYNEAMEDLNTEKLIELIDLYESLGSTDVVTDLKKQLESLKKVAKGWRGEVQSVLTNLGLTKHSSYGLWAEDTTQASSYVEDMIKRYKELKDEIKWVSSFDPQMAERLGKEKEAIEAVSKKLNIDIKDLSANKSEKAESKEEKRIRRLIDSLRELQEQYEKLKEIGVSDEGIKALFKGWYPDLTSENGTNFITDLNFLERAIKYAKELEKLNPNEGKKLLASLGGDAFSIYYKEQVKQQKIYKETAKAAGDYFNTLRKWQAEDFDIEGKGITFDMSKIISDFNEKINEIELRADKAREIFGQIDLDSEEEIAKVKEVFVKEFGANAWNEFWASYTAEGLDAIQNLADAQIAYERKVAQEKVNDLAQKFVKETYFKEGIDLSDFEDKTIFQLKSVRKKLQKLLEKEPLSIPVEIEQRLKDIGVDISNLKNVDLSSIFEAFEDSGKPIDESTKSILKLIQQIQKADISTKDFGETIKTVFKDGLQKLTEEQRKALGDTLASAATKATEVLGNLVDTMREVAEVSGDVELGQLAEELGSITGNLSAAAQGAASGGWIGAIVGGVTNFIDQITSAFTTVKLEEAELESNTRNFVNELRKLKYELDDAFGTIFGGQEMAKALDAQNKMKLAMSDYRDMMDDLSQHALPELYEKQEEFLSLGATLYLPGILGLTGHFAGLAKTTSNEMKGALEAYEKGYSKLEAMQVKTKDKSGFANLFGFKDEYTALKDLAPQLWGPDGVFDIEAAKAFLETTTKLNEQQRLTIQNFIDLSEAKDAAQEALDQYLDALFGGWSTSLADAISEAVLTGADAWEVFGKTASDTIRQIGKDMLQYAFFDAVFDQFRDPLRDAVGNPDEMLKQTTLLMEALASTVPQAQEWLQMFYDKASEAGINMTTVESQGLASGVKGVSEDTANLLASYINAMRADGSLRNTLITQLNGNVQQIFTALNSYIPTLAEYQAQIAANTYNTATATQSILSRLDSVITSEGGLDAIRTYS